MNKSIAKQSAMLGAHYLLYAIQKNGKFIYLRDMKGNPVNGQYNLLRHAGAVWAMHQVFEWMESKLVKLENSWSLADKKPVIEYLEHYIHIMEDDNLSNFLVDDNGVCKLGGNALAYLVFMDSDKATAKNLLDGLKEFINDDGSIKFSKFVMDTGLPSDWESEYYPGEAALALVKAGEFDLCYKVITHLYNNRDKEKPLQDHWLMQAIEILYGVIIEFPEEGFDEQLSLLNNYMEKLTMEIILNPLDYINRACPLACRMEGLIASYKMLGDPLTLDVISNYLNRLVSFQNKEEGKPMYGAFWDKGGYRIDYTQHAICALNSFSNLTI